MSMKPQNIPPVPDFTAAVARAALTKGNIYLQIRDTLGSIYIDEDFTDLFSVRGQPAKVPLAVSLDMCDAVHRELVRSSSRRCRSGTD